MAIEKSPLTTVTNFTYIYVYIYVYILYTHIDYWDKQILQGQKIQEL